MQTFRAFPAETQVTMGIRNGNDSGVINAGEAS